MRGGGATDGSTDGWTPQTSNAALQSETYQFYTEPFCAPPAGKEYKAEGLGEVLEGDRLVRPPPR